MKKRFLGLFVFAACFIGAVPASFAAPTLNVSREDYDIEGDTEQELRDAMNKSGPKDDGGTYDAYTSWNVHWTYQYDKDEDGNCGIESANVIVDVVFRLPKWESDEAPEELQEKWEKYVTVLQKHEDGHKGYGVAAAAKVEEALLELDSEESCDAMGKVANAKGDAIVAEQARLEKEYDVTTKHGASQGAVFP